MVRELLMFGLFAFAWCVTNAAAVDPVEIPGEPIRIKPGDPLSSRALVQRPPQIRGVMSWTLETRRHRGVIYHAVISPDGKMLATGGLDGTIRLWDVETGNFVKFLLGHNHYVYQLAWSPDGNTLASAGADGIAGLWDVKSGVLRRVVRSPKGSVTHIGWSPSGREVAFASGGSGYILVYHVVRGEFLLKDREVALGVPINSVIWSPDGQYVGFTGAQTPVTLLEISDAKQNKALLTTGDVSYALAWSRDGKSVAVTGARGIRLFDFESTDVTRTLAVAAATAVAYSPDGKMLATAATNGPVQLWETEEYQPITTLTGSATTSISWSADSKLLATTTQTTAVVWDVASGKPKQTFDACGTTPPFWSPGKPFINATNNVIPSVFDPNTGKEMCRLEGHKGPINSYAWSKDGKMLATGGTDNTVRLWEMPSGASLGTYNGHTAQIYSIAWLSDGKMLASASADKTVRLWRAPETKKPAAEKGKKAASAPEKSDAESPSGEGTAAKKDDPAAKKDDFTAKKDAADPLIQEFKGHTGPATSVLTPAIGKLLASGSSDKSIKIWNPTTNKLTHTMDAAHAVQAVAWSPDGKVLASSSIDDRIHLWNPANGKLIKSIGTAAKTNIVPSVTLLSWSPNGSMIAVVRRSLSLQLIDVQTEKVLHTFSAMTGVGSAVWSQSGTGISAACSDRTVRFWDVNSELLRGHLINEHQQVSAVSADGHYKAEPGIEADLFYVTQTDRAQETLTIAEFTTKNKWKNNPAAAASIGK